MELVVIEKNAYLRLKQQVEDLSTSLSGAEYFQAEFAKL